MRQCKCEQNVAWLEVKKSNLFSLLVTQTFNFRFFFFFFPIHCLYLSSSSYYIFCFFFFSPPCPSSSHFTLITRFSSERDNYIQINWNNIKPDAWTNFKQFVSHVSMFSTPYDYNSILHYSTKAFAVNRSQDTIMPLHPAPNMGQRKGKCMHDDISSKIKQKHIHTDS